MTEQRAKALVALAALEACATRVHSGATQMRVSLDVGVVPHYSEQLRLANDMERLRALHVEADMALVALEEALATLSHRPYPVPRCLCRECSGHG